MSKLAASPKGRLYVICKSNPRFKAVQGRKKKR
ncbi:50S ribosomal protein L36 [Escherichia coli]|nr:50S ribosomal protein L36 [Escherichia coli]